MLAGLLATPAGPQALTSVQRTVVSDTLRVMHERPFGELGASERALRFLWLRSFHRPILIRVEKQSGTQFLTVKMLDGPWRIGVDGVRLSKLTYQRRRALTAGEWKALAQLTQDGFWKQAASEPVPGGPDGADWIVEGVERGRYHAVARWNPERGPFRELCLAMLGLSAIPLTPDETY